ncbi:MAG: Rrf2 family transcriptional regulator [Pseudomonadota bacterium]
MSTILRISEAANLGIHAMVFLHLRTEHDPRSAAAIAHGLGVSGSHLAKVMQRLVAAGFVGSVRGARGGFTLLADPATTSLLDIYQAIDGPLQPAGCLIERETCLIERCWLAGLEEATLRLVKAHLGSLFLADLIPRSA